jgi:arginine decarboxylase
VLDRAEPSSGEVLPSGIPADLPQPIQDLIYTYDELNVRNILESFHDAQQALDMAINTFAAGFLSLEQRSLTENLFWAICDRIRQLTEQLDFVPDELQGLDSLLAQTYFCNFSIFQSLPDSWAIKQLFPIMPIHRLDEEPTQQAILGDVTCDSDGKIDRFVDRRDVRRTLPLHDLNGEPYYLAAFLIGAYQEILGDLHNLFGDTNAVHVGVSAQGEIKLETIIAGDTVSEVLRYVQFDADKLLQKLRTAVEVAVNEQRIDDSQADYFLRFYEAGLQGYTYLE